MNNKYNKIERKGKTMKNDKIKKRMKMRMSKKIKNRMKRIALYYNNIIAIESKESSLRIMIEEIKPTIFPL